MAVALFKLPAWLKRHLYFNKGFSDLTQTELSDLKSRISRFEDVAPEVSIMIPAWNE